MYPAPPATSTVLFLLDDISLGVMDFVLLRVFRRKSCCEFPGKNLLRVLRRKFCCEFPGENSVADFLTKTLLRVSQRKSCCGFFGENLATNFLTKTGRPILTICRLAASACSSGAICRRGGSFLSSVRFRAYLHERVEAFPLFPRHAAEYLFMALSRLGFYFVFAAVQAAGAFIFYASNRRGFLSVRRLSGRLFFIKNFFCSPPARQALTFYDAIKSKQKAHQRGACTPFAIPLVFRA